ncbi:hypothetical protein KDE13_06645 [Campylobacter sp. faydin G-140]|uniref:hypothetical protein n=1 Tax=Campylobacter anatolicus TaxID=2829105 RepID=UPI001B983EF2|nr:hypothetical protein [Campylobacter anatolicus]MBR8462710.1 hypothetical protein [Campylobacter anatolicus]MBR8466027.1 hypothetical protein [Campylobacter anatolicus]
MKKLILTVILSVFVWADVLRVTDFQTDIYSKAAANLTKKINLNLEVIGRDVVDNESYILDALNVIVGSFYVEDILTSMGKEKFKEMFIKYAAKKHAIDIDDVLILNIKVINDLELREIIKAIQTQNLCSTPMTQAEIERPRKKGNDIIIAPDSSMMDQRPIDLKNIQEFGKDFGEQ